MKKVKDKQVLVGADFAGFPLKEVVAEHLRKKGWTVTDIGVKSADEKEPEMFHRIGLKVGASKGPGGHAGVVESVPAALRAITGNGVNVLAMGAFYVAPQMGKDIADAFLNHNLGDGYEWWPNFYEFHKLAIDELNEFDYEKFKANNFEVERLGDYPLELLDKED